MTNDQILTQLDAIKWRFAEANPTARDELAKRIAHTGHRQDLITYSELVKGVTFKLPTVNDGRPFHIDTSEWRDIDRAMLGDFLGYISAQSFSDAGFFATAIVVNREDRRPSGQFFKWMRDLGLLRGRGEDAETELWLAEVRKAHEWYFNNAANKKPL